MHTNLDVEVWEDASVRSSVWWPYSLGGAVTYLYLAIKKRFQFFDHLRMLVKLLPSGHLWRFEIGEPGDYGS
jgi:hypothetical protein